MKKSISFFLSLSLFLSISLNLSAQSSEKNLDQVELVKQFLGTWVAEVGEDSVMHMKGVQLGEGLYFQGEWKTAGETYYAAHAVVGFTKDKETIVLSKLLRAIEANDYDSFVADGTPEVKASLTKQMLEGVSAQMAPRMKKGYSKTYLGELKQGGCRVYLWKLAYKAGGDDTLARLTLRSGKVAGFLLQ